MVAIASLTMVGCTGISTINTSNVNQNQTCVVLSRKNFHIVKTVSAEVSDHYFLGLGGMRNLEKLAIAELTQKAGLTGSQALINIVTKQSTASRFFLFQERSLYAEATVIAFDE